MQRKKREHPSTPLGYIESRLASYAETRGIDSTPLTPSGWFDLHTVINSKHPAIQSESLDMIVAKSIPVVLGHIALWKSDMQSHMNVDSSGVVWFTLGEVEHDGPIVQEAISVFDPDIRLPKPAMQVIEGRLFKNDPQSFLSRTSSLKVSYEIPLVEAPGYTMGVSSMASYENVFDTPDEMPQDLSEFEFWMTFIRLNLPDTSKTGSGTDS